MLQLYEIKSGLIYVRKNTLICVKIPIEMGSAILEIRQRDRYFNFIDIDLNTTKKSLV